MKEKMNDRNYTLQEKEKMKIAQIGALGLPISKNLIYAGTERVVYNLDSQFVNKGHNSIVFAPGDSEINGQLIPTIPNSLWAIQNNSGGRNIRLGNEKYAEHYTKIIDFVTSSKDVDVVHDHPGNGFINSDEFWERRNEWPSTVPILTTHHGRFTSKYADKYGRWRKLKEEGFPVFFNSISYSQKNEFEKNTGVKVDDIIYHGIPLNQFEFNNKPLDYLFSLGRICVEKGQDYAISVAKKTGRPLIIGGEVHSVNEDYFKEKIEPHLDFSIGNLGEQEIRNYKKGFLERLAEGEDVFKDGQIMFIGGLNDREKSIVYRNAYGYLMPITWPEPFGLVMIESMAAGTPVIGFEYGSVPEVIKDRETGYVIPKILKKDMVYDIGNNDLTNRDHIDEKSMIESMAQATEKLGDISRETTRKRVEKYFTAEKEAENYLNLYQRLIAGSNSSAENYASVSNF